MGIADEQVGHVKTGGRVQQDALLSARLVEDDAGGDHVQVPFQHGLFALLEVGLLPRIVIVQDGNECGWVGILKMGQCRVPGAGSARSSAVLQVKGLCP